MFFLLVSILQGSWILIGKRQQRPYSTRLPIDIPSCLGFAIPFVGKLVACILPLPRGGTLSCRRSSFIVGTGATETLEQNPCLLWKGTPWWQHLNSEIPRRATVTTIPHCGLYSSWLAWRNLSANNFSKGLGDLKSGMNMTGTNQSIYFHRVL